MKKITDVISSKTFKIYIIFIIILGLFLRFYPGKDHIIWNNDDFARDAYMVREMVANKDFIKLIGPRSEVYSFRHQSYLIFTGPLYYYFLTPFYAISKGDPNLPLAASILIHFTSIIPLGLLSYKLFRNKVSVLITIFLFAISYEQIEFSRWLLNPVFTLPFLSWVFYFLWEVINNKKHAFFLGLFIGLAIQSEIFLGYWAIISGLVFIFTRQKFKQWIGLALGGIAGVLPMIIGEIKFGFRMTDSLIYDFLLLPLYREGRSVLVILSQWAQHWGLVARNDFFNIEIKYAFISLLVLFLVAIIIGIKDKTQRKNLYFLCLIMFSPAVIFTTNFVNKAYVDLGVGFSFILLVTFVLNYIWKKSRQYTIFILTIILFSQISLLVKNVENRTPYDAFGFWPTENILFIDKLEIVDSIYEYAQDKPFTISVMDPPYGFPAMWASVFEQYSRRNNVTLPKWFGWYAHETPGDHIFMITDFPENTHVIIRPIISSFDPIAQDIFYQKQNDVSKLLLSIEKNNYRIEFRERINK